MEYTVVIKSSDREVSKGQYRSEKIRNLEIEEGVEIIGEEAFLGNEIKKLYLPKSIKKVGPRAFMDNEIKELTFYNNGIEFGLDSFCCTKEVYYSYISELCSGGFEYCDYCPISKITIIDGDSNILNKIYKNYSDSLREINIVNNSISLSEIRKIKEVVCKNSIKNIKVNIIRNNVTVFANQTESLLIKNGQNKYKYTQKLFDNISDKEIKQSIETIEDIIKLLDVNTKKLIIEDVMILIKEYQKQLQCLKPQFELNNLNLDLTKNYVSPKTLRNNLIISLEKIILKLNFNKNILVLSQKINKYRSFLQDNKEIDIQNDDEFEKIKIIFNMSKILNNSDVLNKLLYLLDQIQVMIKNSLKEDNIIKLTLKDESLDLLFKNQLNEIFNTVALSNNRLSSLYELLSALNKQNNSQLANELKDFEMILANLNDNLKDELEEKYILLKEKYINVANENIEKIKKNKVNIIEAQEIELNFRKELHLILLEIHEKLPGIIKKQDLIRKIYLVNKLLLGEKIEEKGGIIDLVKDIKNLQNNLNLNIHENFLINKKINDKLYSTIKHWEDILTTKDISDIAKEFDSSIGLTDDNLIVEVIIMKKLYEIKLALENYLSNFIECNKYSIKMI